MQRYLNTTQRTIAWFKKAFDAEELDIKAPLQRNPVWTDRQKGSLIETILLEYPIPELYMQEVITEAGAERHVVVDGQQRIRAVLSYLTGESPRVLRRLHTLRRWSHEQEIKSFFTRGSRTRCPHGARTPRRVPLPMGHH